MKILLVFLGLLVLTVNMLTIVSKINAQDPSKNFVRMQMISTGYVVKNELPLHASNIHTIQSDLHKITTASQLENTLNCPWTFDICSGTSDADMMRGTNLADFIMADGGDDYILGGNGSDYINGGHGKDLIYGEQGGDMIEGNNGEDRIDSGSGNDIIFVGQEEGDILPAHVNSTESPSSKDIIDCGDGNDSIYVDSLDVYKNCEIVNGTRLDVMALLLPDNLLPI